MSTDSKNTEIQQCTIPAATHRTCSTCGHKKGSICMLSGYYVTTERMYPTACGQNFEKWIAKPPKIGLKKMLLSFWYGT